MPKEFPSKARYDAENTVRFSVKLNVNTDSDLIAALEAAPSKQGLIKQAIREKIARERPLSD